MKVKHLIGKYINNNFKSCYAFSGGSIMSLIDLINIKMIIPTSESSGGYMSLGYNKSVNKCDTVNIVTSGPGITNALTSITDAYCDSIPLFTISGDVATNMQGKHSFQEAPALELTKPITFWNHSLTNPNETKFIMDKCLRLLNKGKQVHLNLPKDILNMDISHDTILKNEIENDTIQISSNYDIKEVANIINKSRRPVLYIGRGCIGASEDVRCLSISRNIPVTTTLHGLGIYNENHYLSLKMVGMHGSERANNAIQYADCIICIGARFDDRTVGNIDLYGPKAKYIIHINNDISTFNKVIKNTINLYGDANYILKELNNYIIPKHNNFDDPSSLYKKYDFWIKFLYRYEIEFPFNKKLLKQQHILQILNEEIDNIKNLRESLYFVTGVGNHQMYTAQYITHIIPNRFITSGSLGTMGSCNSMAIGVKMANPNNIILAIDGDQSFNMMNDLKTIMNYNISLKIIIMNDSTQSMVNAWEKIFFDKVVATETTNPNYEYISKAYNINYLSVNKFMNLDEIRYTINKFLNFDYDKPIILDCIVDSDFCFPFVPPGNALNDMITYKNFYKNKISKDLAPS